MSHVASEMNWVMLYIWMSHVTYDTNESCHICECVMSHIWLSHVASEMNCVMSHIRMSHVTYDTTETCHVCVWVTSHIWMSHVASDMNWVILCIWMSHVTYDTNEPCQLYEWVMSHIWMSHVASDTNESCHVYEKATSRTARISHVTYGSMSHTGPCHIRVHVTYGSMSHTGPSNPQRQRYTLGCVSFQCAMSHEQTSHVTHNVKVSCHIQYCMDEPCHIITERVMSHTAPPSWTWLVFTCESVTSHTIQRCHVTQNMNEPCHIQTERVMSHTRWRRPIRCLISWIKFHKLATNSRAFLQKMTYKDTASFEFVPPCTAPHSWTWLIFTCESVASHTISMKYITHKMDESRHKRVPVALSDNDNSICFFQ